MKRRKPGMPARRGRVRGFGPALAWLSGADRSDRSPPAPMMAWLDADAAMQAGVQVTVEGDRVVITSDCRDFEPRGWGTFADRVGFRGAEAPTGPPVYVIADRPWQRGGLTDKET